MSTSFNTTTPTLIALAANLRLAQENNARSQAQINGLNQSLTLLRNQLSIANAARSAVTVTQATLNERLAALTAAKDAECNTRLEAASNALRNTITAGVNGRLAALTAAKDAECNTRLAALTACLLYTSPSPRD